MAERIECAVIGAGVVGLATARELARAGREVVVLEAESAFGTHTSSRNSRLPGTWPAWSRRSPRCPARPVP